MASASQQWIEDHADYPHDYCLIWPFSRDPVLGRGRMQSSDGKQQWAHRIMCERAHGPAPTPKHESAHSCGNGDQGCINPRHLSWKTRSENQIERYRVHGRGNKNARGNHSMFTEQQIAEIKAKFGQFTQLQLASMYGCSQSTILYYVRYREERGHAGRKLDIWSPDEDQLLRDAIARKLTFPKIAEVVGRAPHSCAQRARRLGLRSLSGWHKNGVNQNAVSAAS